MKLGAKGAKLVQKFVPQSRIGIFRNDRTQSTPLDHKLMFWCVLYHLGAFGAVRWPYETRGKTGLISAKVRATKSRRNFSNEHTRSTPLDPKSCFGAFRMILVHLEPFGCLTKLGAKWAEQV